MEANSSNDSHSSHPHVVHLHDMSCYLGKPTCFVFISFTFTNIVVFLPLCTIIVHHGLQQWRKKHSSSSSAAMSHSDRFTYHMVAMELVQVLGCVVCCCGVFMNHSIVLYIGKLGLSLNWFGGLFFHILTCVERYLAVVHAITYMRLKSEKGVRIMNVFVGCVWLLSPIGVALTKMEFYSFIDFVLLISSLACITFCCLSVLRILIRPGPGEQGGSRVRVDQSKQRAFYTITVILGALLLRVIANLSWSVFDILDKDVACAISMVEYWVTVPSSLILPLLFLHRGRHLCRKSNTQGT